MEIEALTTGANSAVQQAKQRLGIVGTAPALNAAVERALRVAPIDLSVLVTGESGSGKEFFPKLIHQYSARKHAKYIAVNCGAIPEGTIDSELFGHEKGAFTGAVGTRKGYFEEAHGGTIFLDEVAELPLTTQARLLRVLESGEFIKVGSSTVQKTNIRVVAATNVDMLKAVAEGRFREDLYYRLSTVQIQIPPLRDRGNDVALLARKFAADFAERYRTPAIEFSDAGRQALLRYRWPGNVRQLKNAVEQIALFMAGKTIGEAEVQEFLPQGASQQMPALAGTAGGSAYGSDRYDRERETLFNLIFRLQRRVDELEALVQEAPAEPQHAQAIEVTAPEAPTTSSLVRLTHYDSPVATLEETELEMIKRALERNGGRRKAAAQELNISERTLYRKIREYGLE